MTDQTFPDGLDVKIHSPAPEPPPRRFSAEWLEGQAFAPINFVVPNYLAPGLTILAGRPKLGKSWLALQIALGVADGGLVLGEKCREGSVLFAALEDNPRRLQARLRKVRPSGDWPACLEFQTELSPLGAGGVGELREWLCGAKDPRLIVVDTLGRVRGGADSRRSPYDQDVTLLDELQHLAAEHDVAIVLIHHVRKGVADDPVDSISGSLGLAGTADSFLVLQRDAGGVTLYGRGRDVEEIETAVEFDKEQCTWSVLGDRSEVRRSDERRRILDALARAARPCTPSEIAALCDMKNDPVRRLLVKMAEAGEIVRPKRGQYAHPDCDHTHCGHNGHNGHNDVGGPEKSFENNALKDDPFVTGSAGERSQRDVDVEIRGRAKRSPKARPRARGANGSVVWEPAPDLERCRSTGEPVDLHPGEDGLYEPTDGEGES